MLPARSPCTIRHRRCTTRTAVCSSRVDLLTPNETEFAHLLARCTDARVDADALADLGDEVLHALCRRLGVPTLVLTLGARGVCSFRTMRTRCAATPAACYRVPAEAVQVRDTTGAGDAFSGSLAAALLRRKSPVPRRRATRQSRRGPGVETPGAALAMPTRAAVSSRFDR